MLETKQEVIGKIKEKFQGVEKLSKDSSGKCLYGPGVNGIGCALGCLMPRNTDWEMLEGNSTFDSHVRDAIYKEVDKKISTQFFDQVQYCHDDADSVAEFLDRLDELQTA